MQDGATDDPHRWLRYTAQHGSSPADGVDQPAREGRDVARSPRSNVLEPLIGIQVKTTHACGSGLQNLEANLVFVAQRRSLGKHVRRRPKVAVFDRSRLGHATSIALATKRPGADTARPGRRSSIRTSPTSSPLARLAAFGV